MNTRDISLSVLEGLVRSRAAAVRHGELSRRGGREQAADHRPAQRGVRLAALLLRLAGAISCKCNSI
jgi:hypothetical protein